jgi:hypothetical protein
LVVYIICITDARSNEHKAFGHISLISSWNESKHTFCIQRLSFLENPAVYEIMRKNVVQPSRLQMTI